MSLEDLVNVEVTAPSKKPEAEAPAVVQVITASEISWLGLNTPSKRSSSTQSDCRR